MPNLIRSDGTEITDLPSIQNELIRVGTYLRKWKLPEEYRFQELINEPSHDQYDKDELLGFIDYRFENLKFKQGYTTQDLINLSDQSEESHLVISRIERLHYHIENEVRFVLAGTGYFGFLDKDNNQFILEVSAGDYLNIPANTLHWFTLGDSQRFLAARYFIDCKNEEPLYIEDKAQLNSNDFSWQAVNG